MLFVECPHCSQTVEIHENEINCAIFRHGVLKANYQQIPPHAPKEVCDMLAQRNLIYGCGRPFRLTKNPTDGGYKAEICEYI